VRQDPPLGHAREAPQSGQVVPPHLHHSIVEGRLDSVARRNHLELGASPPLRSLVAVFLCLRFVLSKRLTEVVSATTIRDQNEVHLFAAHIWAERRLN
jgi:hypothetical protein